MLRQYSIRGAHLDKEWLRPRLIVARSFGSRPFKRAPNWLRIPRKRSSVSTSEITLIPSFLLIGRAESQQDVSWLVRRSNQCRVNAPSFGSTTTNSSLFLPFSTTTLFRNSFKPFPSFPSCIAVISSTAVAVDVNRCRDFNFSLHRKLHRVCM